jgi:hypothetical protein
MDYGIAGKVAIVTKGDPWRRQSRENGSCIGRRECLSHSAMAELCRQIGKEERLSKKSC